MDCAVIDTQGNVVRVAAGDFVAALRDLIDEHSPALLVVEGDEAEWRSLTALEGFTPALAYESPLAVVGVCRGERRADLSQAARWVDLWLAGDGPDLTSLAAWESAFLVAPQAATLLITMTRSGATFAHESWVYSLLQAGREHRRWLRDLAPSTTNFSDDGERVRLSLERDIGVIELVRPQSHNAYDSQMREAFCDAIDAAVAAGARALGICAAGPSFCSGGDLHEFGTLRDPVSAHFIRVTRSVAARLDALTIPTVVAIHGWSIGAGFELASFADYVLAADDTQLRLPEIGMGLIPGAGGTVGIPRRIGRKAFLDIALSGSDVTASEALALGFVNELVSLQDQASRLRQILEEFVMLRSA
jgi:enoyl-CoA hydratase/carnithine racemase